MITKPKKLVRAVYHHENYAFSDSPFGLLDAKKNNYEWADINAHVSKSGRCWVTHWLQPMLYGWIDPLGKLDPHTPITQMSDAEVMRLRYPADKRLRILSLAAMFRFANRIGMNLELEPKNSAAWRTAAPWVHVRANADKAKNIRIQVKMLTTFKHLWQPTLRQAHRQKFPTIVLPRGDFKVPVSTWTFLDMYKGTVRWTLTNGKVSK